jgi:hypothetical protein
MVVCHVHHATPFYKITETVSVQEQSAKKDNEFGTMKAETKKGLETYTSGVS